MQPTDTLHFPPFLTYLLIAMGIALVVSLAGLALIAHRVRNLHIPATADLFTTMHHVPLVLVVLLDLLDFSLDIFSAPIVWLVLNRMGLSSLRNTATVQAVIPISNTIPCLTIAWVAAHLFKLGTPSGPSVPSAHASPPALEDAHAHQQTREATSETQENQYRNRSFHG